MDLTALSFPNLQLENLPVSPNVAQTYLHIALTVLIAILVDNLLRSFIKLPKKLDNKRARTIVTVIQGAITAGVYLIALNIIIIELGIDITPLLASAGIIGVILGISARPIIEDLLSGLFLISQDKIAIGDYVKIEDLEGYIESIDLRTITIRSGSGGLHIIPNGIVKKLTNYSRHRTSTFIDLPVKSDQKIDKVIKAATEALEMLQADEDFARYLLPGSLVNGIENYQAMNGMTIRVTLVTPHAMNWKVSRQYRLYVKELFEKYKIEFA